MSKKGKKSKREKKGDEAVISDSKLEITVEKKKKKPSLSFVKWIVLVIVVIILFFLLTSTKELESTQTTNYTVTEEYSELVPYTIVEEYQTKEPYGSPYCSMKNMNFSATLPEKSIAGNNTIRCSFELTNHEDKAGKWRYRAYLQTNEGPTGNQYDEKVVNARSTETFNFELKIKPSVTTFSCHISGEIFPSMQKCFFPEDTFYKVVTKTREIIKYKNVTKERDITFSNQTIAQKTVNRFFGYEMKSFGW